MSAQIHKRQLGYIGERGLKEKENNANNTQMKRVYLVKFKYYSKHRKYFYLIVQIIKELEKDFVITIINLFILFKEGDKGLLPFPELLIILGNSFYLDKWQE